MVITSKEMSKEVSKVFPIVFAFWLMIASAYMPELAGCQVRRILEHSMAAKHVVGVIMVYSGLVILDTKFNSNSITRNIARSFIVYIVFLLTTRMHLFVFFMVVGLSFLTYYLYQTKNESENTPEQISEIEKTVINISCLIAVLIVLGVVMYANDKRIEYEDEFSWLTFFNGKVVCRYN